MTTNPNYEFEDILVEWQCPDCGHMNEDFIDKTAQPICGVCEEDFSWLQIDGISYCDGCGTSYPSGGGYLDDGLCWKCGQENEDWLDEDDYARYSPETYQEDDEDAD